jgi:hypothetical protein
VEIILATPTGVPRRFSRLVDERRVQHAKREVDQGLNQEAVPIMAIAAVHESGYGTKLT